MGVLQKLSYKSVFGSNRIYKSVLLTGALKNTRRRTDVGQQMVGKSRGTSKKIRSNGIPKGGAATSIYAFYGDGSAMACHAHSSSVFAQTICWASFDSRHRLSFRRCGRPSSGFVGPLHRFVHPNHRLCIQIHDLGAQIEDMGAHILDFGAQIKDINCPNVRDGRIGHHQRIRQRSLE